MSADFHGPENGSRADEPTFDERVNTAVAEELGRRGYITEDGHPDSSRICDVLEGSIGKAVATKKSERAKVCITRRAIMELAFPGVPGPESWADQGDPDLAEATYKRLEGICWRQTAITPNGALQERFNSDHGMVLCRTKVNPHRTDAVYVTRDLGCLLEDVIKPQRENQKKRGDRDAALTAMLIERIPEHGRRFNRELVGGLTTALNSAKAITAGVLEAASVADEEPDEDSDAGDE